MLEYFKDPANRLKALEFAYQNVKSFQFICYTIEAFVRNELSTNISINGYYDNPHEDEFQLHILIPELIHPIDLGIKDHLGSAWGGSLHRYYNDTIGINGSYLEAKLLHIQKAIDLVKTKIK